MFYSNLKFPKPPRRPFFYTNFVSTVDGKVWVFKNPENYWPIGSKTDYQVLTELRVYADCLIHGKNLAKQFGEITIKSLNKSSFKRLRKRLNKEPDLPYYVLTKHPADLKTKGPASLKSTWKESKPTFQVDLPGICQTDKTLKELSRELYKKGFRNVLVEGGPTLLASFLKADLLDEIFLTIAPKIFGNEKNKTLTLVEGYLFPKNAIKKLSLLSVKKRESEIYLRYKVIR